MRFPFGLPRDASPRLKVIQGCQLSITALTILATLFAAVIPHKHKRFTLGLLYPLIFVSFSTTFLVRREQRRAREGTLSKQRYVKYQLYKLFAAFGLAFVGFVADIITSDAQCDTKRPGETGLWLRCIKVNTWQGLILWLNFFNWVFIWAGVFYSCCMTGNRQGAIALNGEEANIGLEGETANDEAVATNL
ncbi:hypothetical protein BU23DRAFT_515040 [Bimuria novae-zelandiae CBS 107.79]|uniref:MARVEL domain-containing protein n=1 Tax=Bimuria novae-zelandiae CBS 107.79 TaxID=1447943 RepID=A0A6A5UWL7_9PLEO|nr:hypothetical protein BU23DRAFT_515040 [Bimuria novae-zelandiae CBS 107.79]